jgi:hypothetical protein
MSGKTWCPRLDARQPWLASSLGGSTRGRLTIRRWRQDKGKRQNSKGKSKVCIFKKYPNFLGEYKNMVSLSGQFGKVG